MLQTTLISELGCILQVKVSQFEGASITHLRNCALDHRQAVAQPGFVAKGAGGGSTAMHRHRCYSGDVWGNSFRKWTR